LSFYSPPHCGSQYHQVRRYCHIHDSTSRSSPRPQRPHCGIRFDAPTVSTLTTASSPLHHRQQVSPNSHRSTHMVMQTNIIVTSSPRPAHHRRHTGHDRSLRITTTHAVGGLCSCGGGGGGGGGWGSGRGGRAGEHTKDERTYSIRERVYAEPTQRESICSKCVRTRQRACHRGVLQERRNTQAKSQAGRREGSGRRGNHNR